MRKENRSKADWLDQAMTFRSAGRLDDVISVCRHQTDRVPHCAEAWFVQGIAEWERGDTARAEEALTRAIQGEGDHAAAYNALGVLLLEAGRIPEAEAILARGVTVPSPTADLYCNLGRALMLQKRFDEAMNCYEMVLGIDPNHAVALSNMAVVHQSCRRLPSAIACYRRALQLDPHRPDWWANLGAALLSQARYRPAESCFRTALMLAGNHPTAAKGLGVTSFAQGRYETAARVLEDYLSLCPDDAEASTTLAIVYQHTANWQGYHRILPSLHHQTVKSLSRNEVPSEQPLFNISRSDDVRLNLAVARAWSSSIAKRARRQAEPFSFDHRKPSMRQRITIGYLSADFRNHAVAHQLVSLFELHDHSRFRICGFAVGADSEDPYRRRIASACDHFQNLADLDAASAARAIHDQQVDILIDLMGHTQQNRLDICALRPAPVQISYLGFLSTSGADYIDYLIGDPVVIPDEHAPYFSEKIIRLPHCYQIISPNPASGGDITRQEAALPADGFVFCCFNQVYKIGPFIFDSWMRILKQIPGAVLWLYRSGDDAMSRLRKEAHRHGVAAERLVFAGKLPLADHLARLRLADVALDTPRYNGGATTANALAAGVPVITTLGRHFVTRMSASHLVTLGLRDLIAADLPAYEKLAVELARTPAGLAEVKQRLENGLAHSPLMDADGFVRNLETALGRVWQRHCAGQPPERIDLA